MIAFDVGGSKERVHFHDLHPESGDLVTEALRGLRESPKSLPCKYFYDTLGARLFEAITELQEYYPTRTELGIMSDHSREMAHAIGAHSTLVEFGSGASTKTRRLLDALHDPAGCVLIDISREKRCEHPRQRYPSVTRLKCLRCALTIHKTSGCRCRTGRATARWRTFREAPSVTSRMSKRARLWLASPPSWAPEEVC